MTPSQEPAQLVLVTIDQAVASVVLNRRHRQNGWTPGLGKAYFDAHGKEKHAVALESDFGADRVWRIDFKLPDSAKALSDRLAAAVMPFGVVRGRQPANGGADIGALVRAGVPAVDLAQDGTRYFDLHHTPDDTLDKIDPVQLRQNVVVWSAVLAILANSEDSELP